MPESAAPIRLEQALHGYDNGHRLLAASLRLDNRDERAMLGLSDLSGPRVAEGFLEYITAYPLPSGRYYAFAKTWYATEMERPGCVWTHTIFVNSYEVEQIHEVDSILNRFRRPDMKSVATGEYESATYFKFESGSSLTEPFSLVKEILNSLYNTNEPVIFSAENGTQFEKLCLKLWSQQWPELRMNFSFCTGALSQRSLLHRTLDLQFGPSRLVRSVNQRSSGSEAEWLWDATVDLQSPSGTQLRSFLHDVGRRLTAKSDFSRLCSVYHAFASKGRCAGLQEALKSFSESSSGRLVREWSISRFSGSKNLELLECLLDCELDSELDPDELGITRRAADLLTDEPDGALSLLSRSLKQDTNPIRSAYAKALATALDREDFEYLTKFSSDTLLELVQRAPKIATRDEFWSPEISLDDKKAILLNLYGADSPYSQDVIRTLLRTHDYRTAVFAIELMPEMLRVVLEWLSREDVDLAQFLRPEWLNLFRNGQQQVLGWFSGLPSVFSKATILLAHTVDPRSKTNLPILSIEAFIASAHAAREVFDEHDEVAAFYFIIGIRYGDPLAASIVSSSFRVLHQRLERSSLSQIAWEILNPDLPAIEEWWNYCEKLRRLTFSIFEEKRWPLAIMWELFRKDECLFADFVETAKGYPPGRRFIEMLWDEFEHEMPRGYAKRVKKLLR